MKRLYLLFIAAAAGVVTGCSGDKSGAAEEVSIIIHPKVMTRVGDNNFESGDKIGVNILLSESGYGASGSTYADNEEMVHNGEYFAPAEELKWYGSGSESTFEAYFPYMDDPETPFLIETDQTGDGYARADFLMARATGVSPNAGGVSMSFYHIMSQLVINIQNQSVYEITEVIISGTDCKGWLSFTDQTVVKPVINEKADITAQRLTEETYRAVLIPQQVAVTLKIKSGNNGIIATQEFKENHFVLGTSYRINLAVNSDFDITDVEIITDGEIGDWTEGGELEKK
ncbi:MAG: fimbrillin family protein [Rikenellaceae bacterium]|nr:fimbrillin family protein [Rikenellaceae bacterium]